jgi:adenylate cyclase
MAEQQIKRRLAAILAADIVGYSSMMAADEIGTLAALREIWSDPFNSAIAARHGRIVKMMGDGALVEFGSVVDAVECAIAIQRSMHARNSSAERAIEFRIGINAGDIVSDGDDILGDGVNVAARLESEAPKGGILVSDVVQTQVKGKVSVTFVDAGEIKLKNIDLPLRAWRWQEDDPGQTTSRAASLARPRPADQPSLAVLPFAVMSNAPEQEFFADGLVEDILTTLSKLSGLSVIARQSSFVYKGRAVDVRQVARELGVRYVLEGSVRKGADRIRITTQLIDAATGVHVWAERFDRSLEDIFAVQDEISLTLATEMQVRLTEGEQARLRYTTTTNVEAWSLFIEGMNLERAAATSSGHAHLPGRRCWEKALALDPGSAVLNALLGNWHFADARHNWTSGDRETALRKAEAYVDRALAIDPDNPDAHRTISGVLLMRAQFEEAAAAARKALKLGPSLPDVLAFGSFVLACCGYAAEGISHVEKAVALNPSYPAWYLGVLGNSYRLAGRTDDAMRALRAYHARLPGYGLGDLVMIQEQSGHLKEARETAAQLLAARPTFTVKSWLKTQSRVDKDQMAADLASLRAAGVPEE